MYDCLVSLLDEKGAKFCDIRRVLERGMKTGAISLMKDVRGDVIALYAGFNMQHVFHCLIEWPVLWLL